MNDWTDRAGTRAVITDGRLSIYGTPSLTAEDGSVAIGIDTTWNALVAVTRAVLDTHYPADVFDGSSGDPGPVFVARLRDALTDLDAAPRYRREEQT